MIRKALHSLSMAKKFLLLSAMTFILPLGFFVYFSYMSYSSTVDNKLFQMTENVLSLIEKNVQYTINDVSDTGNIIMTSGEVQSVLSVNPDAADYHQQILSHETAVEDLLINLTNNKQYIGTILLALLFVPALNLAGMIASRMKRQLSEMGIRKAFGASKASLLMQVFWENLFLTGLGGLLGLLLSYLIVYCGRNWLPDLLSAYSDVIPEGVDSFLTPGMLLNPVVIGITFLVSLILNVLSALIPALHALKKDIVYSLNDKR